MKMHCLLLLYTHPHCPLHHVTQAILLLTLIHPSLLRIIQWQMISSTPLSETPPLISIWFTPHYLGSSSDPVARSVILGYFTFFLSSSSCDHSNSFRRLASFGVESFSWMAAFSSLATCQQETENGLLYMNEYCRFLNKMRGVTVISM